MSDFPPSPPTCSPLHIHTKTPWGLGADSFTQDGKFGGGALTWTANLAIYQPVYIPFNYPVARVFWVNGSTITTSNAAFGIYTADGTQLYATASTALSGASNPQYVTPSTPFVLSPGFYYFAYICDGTTSRGFGWAVTVNRMRTMGCYEQAVGSMTLPATATFAQAAHALLPLCGVTRTASGF